MDLKIKDVAELLNVSEAIVRRWVADGKIPTYRMNQQEYFSRTEIESWVISNKFDKHHHASSPSLRNKENEQVVIPPPCPSTRNGNKQFSLFRAVYKGDVLHHLMANSKEDVIRNVMKKVAKNLHVDEEIMTDLLLERELLMPTALNNGIAVPHTRDTLLNAHHDAVVVVFLDTPLEYGALDGKPVHTLFFLFACEDKRHLHLLAKIAHLSNQPHALDFLLTKPSKQKLLAFMKTWENQITRPI